MVCLPTAMWRTLLIIVTFLTALVGIGLIAIGAFSLSVIGLRFAKLLRIYINLLLLLLGIIILIISAIGFFGSIKKSPQILALYGGLSVVICLCAIGIGVLAALMRQDTRHFRDKVAELYNNIDAESMVAIDELQRNLECCGPDGPAKMEVIIPSCCDAEMPECSREEAFKSGCKEQTEQAIRQLLLNAMWTAAVTFGVCLLCAIFAFCIQADERRKRQLNDNQGR